MTIRLFAFTAMLATTLACAIASPALAHEGAADGHNHSPFQAAYESAVEYLDRGAFHKAEALLAPLANGNPFHPQWAEANGLLAYTYYQQDNYKALGQTLAAVREKQPQNAAVPYIIYLNGLVNFERMKNVTHDQSYTKAALRNFMELRQNFPETPYAEAALPRIDAAIEQLAGKEIEVARHYQKNTQHLAAIKRLNTVVNVFNESAQVPEALFRLWENYTALGLPDQATPYAQRLKGEFGESDWAGRV